jgi:hypothetical protein
MPREKLRTLRQRSGRKGKRWARRLYEGFKPRPSTETSIRLSAALGAETVQVFVLMTEHQKTETRPRYCQLLQCLPNRYWKSVSQARG